MRSEKSRALARDFSLRAEGVNNEGRVALRSVLYLSYLKHDQKIDCIRKNNNYCLYLPYDRGRRHVECLPFPPDDARKLIIIAFRQMATLVFATSRSTMDKRLINSRNTTTIVFIYTTTMHYCLFPLYQSINPSQTMSRPHHDPRFLLPAERWNNALRCDWLVLRLGAGPTSR